MINYPLPVPPAADALTSLIGADLPWARSYARWIAGIVFLSVLFTSTIAAPPHPAPVKRAPSAPAPFAAATTVSSSGERHSYRRRHDSCDSYSSLPNCLSLRCCSSCAANRVRAVSLTTCTARERNGSRNARLRRGSHSAGQLASHCSSGSSILRRFTASSHSVRRSLSPPVERS